MALDKNLDKLGKLLATLDENHLSKADFAEEMKRVVEFLVKNNKANRDEFSEVTKTLGQTIATIRSDLDREIGSQRERLSQAEQTSLSTLETRLAAIEASVQARLAELRDGESPAVEAIVEAMKPHIPLPIPGSPDSAEDIRNKLELLEGDERLSIEAIRGLKEMLEKKPNLHHR